VLLLIGALWYLDFKAGEDKAGKHYSGWSITRGYINIKKKITPWFSARVTPDVTRDRDGDVKVRLKYLYGRIYFKVSYQVPSFTITAEYARDKGCQNGFYKGNDGKLYRDERDKRGFSFWGMFRIPWYKKLRIWARYDVWDPDLDMTDDIQKRLIGSISYDIYKGVKGCGTTTRTITMSTSSRPDSR